MRTIKIIIAAAGEMHEETLKFSELIANLNEVLNPRGIELKRVKWNPETDGSIEEFKRRLADSEMCLTLYWRSLAGNSEQELDTAYEELKKGNNPRKLYVFFKEPSDEVTESLKGFKANFVNTYGHFFCKFENADTMNLHFILQFEAYNNQVERDLIKVSEGKVFVGGKEMVELKNIPFAAMNKEYQRLQQELSSLDEEIAGISIRYAANTKDGELLRQLSSLGSKREEVSKEFERYQTHLYAIALNFAKLSADRYSERMKKARELFERGNTIEADRILDMEEMKREAKNELKLHEQNIRNLETIIEEFCMKADTVMANDSLSVPDRLKEACEAYEEAIAIARKTHYDQEKIAKILFNYADLLQSFNRMQKAVSIYREALPAYRALASKIPDAYLPDVADTLNNLGILQCDLRLFSDAEKSYQEALEIRRALASMNPDAYLPNVAETLNNLGFLQHDLRLFDDAEKSYQEALEIRRALASKIPDAYLPKVAGILNNLGNLQRDLRLFDDAEKSYQEALAIHRELASKNPDAYLPNVAVSLNNLGVLQHDLRLFSKAEKSFQEALAIHRELASKNPDAYLPNVAVSLNNLGNLQRDLRLFSDAEKSYQEALEIRRALASKIPDAYLPNVAETLNNLGNLQRDLRLFSDAEKSYQEALEIRHALASKIPDAYLPDVAMILYNLGNLQYDLRLFDDAEKSYQEALEIRRALASMNPDAYLPDVADTLNNLVLPQFS